MIVYTHCLPNTDKRKHLASACQYAHFVCFDFTQYPLSLKSKKVACRCQATHRRLSLVSILIQVLEWVAQDTSVQRTQHQLLEHELYAALVWKHYQHEFAEAQLPVLVKLWVITTRKTSHSKQTAATKVYSPVPRTGWWSINYLCSTPNKSKAKAVGPRGLLTG